MRHLFHGLFVATHVFVLISFAAGLLGRYVNPHAAWWLQPFAIALPAIAFILAILTPFAAGMRLWILAAVSTSLLVVFGLRYIAAAGRGADLEGDAMTVMTMNAGGRDVRQAGDDRGLADILPEILPDVACLQEFSAGDREDPSSAVNQMLESLGYGILAPYPPEGHRGPPSIISRVEFSHSSVVGLTSRRAPDPAGTLVRTRLSWQGRPFVVYNVHLQSFTTHRPWVEGNAFSLGAWIRFLRRTSVAFLQRADEAVEIRLLLDQEDLPFLLCGDFNTTPHQWTYSKLSSGLQDAYRTAGGLWGPTFPAGWPLFRIDYLIASRHWKVGEVSVGPRLRPDHRPVMGRFALED